MLNFTNNLLQNQNPKQQSAKNFSINFNLNIYKQINHCIIRKYPQPIIFCPNKKILFWRWESHDWDVFCISKNSPEGWQNTPSYIYTVSNADRLIKYTHRGVLRTKPRHPIPKPKTNEALYSPRFFAINIKIFILILLY